MKSKKGKYIKFIITIISIGIFVYSYFVVHNKYTKKTEEAYRNIELIKLEMLEREKKLEEEEEILLVLDKVNKEKQEIMDTYPVYIAKEDNFMFVEKLQNNLGIDISSLNISDNTGFYKTILPAVSHSNEELELMDNVNEEGTENVDSEEATMNGIVNTITMNFRTSYEGLKELSEYIRKYPEPTAIDNVSISYDISTSTLAGNLTLKRFALTGTGKEYQGTSIEGINIGIENIFGTGGVDGPEKVTIDRRDDNEDN